MELLRWPPYVLEFALFLAVCGIYYYVKSPFVYWKKRGVVQVDLKHPIFGNALVSFTSSIYGYLQLGYREFPNEKFVGKYELWRPSLLIRDPNLIETVLVKDFSHFVNRAGQVNPNGFAAKHLLNLSDNHWKSVRSKLNPTFSSGKLKGMHSQLLQCGESLIKYLNDYEGSTFEVRGIMQRFTMDVIASCAFGLNTDTINDPNSEFRKMGMVFSRPTLLTKIQFLFNLRGIAAKLKIDRFIFKTKSQAEYFVNVVNETLNHRKQNNVVRPDFLHLTNELVEKDLENKEEPYKFDRNTLVSNALVFFLAGFETTAATISFALYELAINPNVQDQAYKEVSHVLSKYGVLDYSAVQDLIYLDQVISETLRKYPPVAALSRKTVDDYQLPGTDVVLTAGTVVHIPIFSLHYDPQYYPNPELFQPERFDKDNSRIAKGTYLPFGDGPRMCIGARFAKIEAKLCLAMILNKYKIVKSDKTQVPLSFNKKAFLLAPEKGIWLTIQRR